MRSVLCMLSMRAAEVKKKSDQRQFNMKVIYNGAKLTTASQNGKSETGSERTQNFNNNNNYYH